MEDCDRVTPIELLLSRQLEQIHGIPRNNIRPSPPRTTLPPPIRSSSSAAPSVYIYSCV